MFSTLTKYAALVSALCINQLVSANFLRHFQVDQSGAVGPVGEYVLSDPANNVLIQNFYDPVSSTMRFKLRDNSRTGPLSIVWSSFRFTYDSGSQRYGIHFDTTPQDRAISFDCENVEYKATKNTVTLQLSSNPCLSALYSMFYADGIPEVYEMRFNDAMKTVTMDIQTAYSDFITMTEKTEQ